MSSDRAGDLQDLRTYIIFKAQSDNGNELKSIETVLYIYIPGSALFFNSFKHVL
jgi:hypothetical protein